MCAQGRQLLHRLVGGAVLAQADRVVGEHEDGLLPHQRRQAHGVAGVLHEHEEGGAVVDKAAVQGNAVHDGGHAEFTHAVIDIVAAGGVPADPLRAAPEGEIGTGQIGGTAQQLRQQRAEGVEAVLGSLARGDGRALLLALLYIGGGTGGKVGWQLARQPAPQFCRQFRVGAGISVHFFFPGLFGGGATGPWHPSAA